MFVAFFLILAIVIVLIGRLISIELRSGEKYEKIVLSQQEYNSQTIPFRRGDIVDRKGTILATSTEVYNVILDCSVLNAKKEYLEPTIEALVDCFGFEEDKIRKIAEESPKKRYNVLAKKLPYEKIEAFEKLQEDEKNGVNIKGVWFEKEYIRKYPYNSLASSVLGFTTSGNVGIGGLEDYYNETLNGTDGRTYGYLNEDSNFEQTVKEAVNGQNVVSTIDANIQSIVEEKIKEFDDAYKDNHVEGNGALHLGVILMDPNTAEVLAMANYPNFDCNNAWDLSAYYSEKEIDAMSEDETLDALNEIWQNFCTTYTYEPGSTAKPFTIASGLETGTLTGNETFVCDGSEKVGGHKIRCVNRSGHGVETIEKALNDSCNDALMQMSYRIGEDNFCKYQQVFNFGLKTNIDLPGEARTDSLIYNRDTMNATALATNAFGQNFNVTMIQMASAYCSLINGGSYYQPHMVSKITDENGNTVKTVEPTLLKETVSEETSETILGYLATTVSEGTAKTAKVDGYSMGGKTGTAQKLPRGSRNYLVSFIGNVPAEDPEVMIYVVVDQPNVEDQPHSTYAQHIAREILEEVLPYMNIYPDEELKGTNANLDVTGKPVKSSDGKKPTQKEPRTDAENEDHTGDIFEE